MDFATQCEQDYIFYRATLRWKENGRIGCLMKTLPCGYSIIFPSGKKCDAPNVLSLCREAIDKGDMEVINGAIPNE